MLEIRTLLKQNTPNYSVIDGTDVWIKEDIRKALDDMYKYMEIALDELENLNNKDLLTMNKIRDNQKRLKSSLQKYVFGEWIK